ncbi:MAG TPA: hypothetical protein VFL69_08390, partial [Marmoricola sp.]|nr:hypothetical protein [Marmoricola sp.]
AAAAIWNVSSSGPAEVVFEWSPCRLDPRYTGDRTAFDAAFLIGEEHAPRHIIGIETKYHEHAVAEKRPDAMKRLPRYREITERSGIFRKGWENQVLETELQQVWRDHLLLLSMLQHPSGKWAGGLYALVYPARNPSFREIGERYLDLLTDDATFAPMAVEELLDMHVLHRPQEEAGFRERYLW